jgi:hypothetical protein
MADNFTLVNQLRALLLLTQTEEQIARIRISQARTDAVRRELSENADNAADRTRAIADQLRILGGVPDVVTPAWGRLGALVKATLEQVEPIEEALLQDLALEHQLLDRATYLKVLADSAGRPGVTALAERLITAHEATVEWLTVVLAEQALGGPAALVATPFQRMAGSAARAMYAPVRFVGNAVNKAVDTVQHVGEQAEAGARTAREELGDVPAGELPIEGYDALATSAAAQAVKQLTEPRDIRVIIRYEETHKNRSSVVSAAQTALKDVAKDALGVSN